MHPFDSPRIRAIMLLDYYVPLLHRLWIWLWHRELARLVRRTHNSPSA